METDSREKTLHMAANVLEYRHRSSRALYQRLLEKGAEEQDAAYAVSRLQQMGFLNDGEYGAMLVRDLCRRGYGPRRIRQYLREKLLDPPDIERAMEAYVFIPKKCKLILIPSCGDKIPTAKRSNEWPTACSAEGFPGERFRAPCKIIL